MFIRSSFLAARGGRFATRKAADLRTVSAGGTRLAVNGSGKFDGELCAVLPEKRGQRHQFANVQYPDASLVAVLVGVEQGFDLISGVVVLIGF
jgi:hypothetical protein